jgi:hypothetical protein
MEQQAIYPGTKNRIKDRIQCPVEKAGSVERENSMSGTEVNAFSMPCSSSSPTHRYPTNHHRSLWPACGRSIDTIWPLGTCARPRRATAVNCCSPTMERRAYAWASLRSCDGLLLPRCTLPGMNRQRVELYGRLYAC